MVENDCLTNLDNYNGLSNELLSMIIGLRKQVTLMQTKIKNLESNFKKEIKQSNKAVSSKTKIKGPRKPSGFAKPSKISDILSSFMEKSPDTLVARTEVTQYLIKYIKTNSLQDPNNKRKIIPDKKLLELLDSGDDEITFFNLQKYMNKHFIKDNS
tara:strand:+ start:102 stop:569 length:468 start_codon:yes stop_codon:yes gene_type:complete